MQVLLEWISAKRYAQRATVFIALSLILPLTTACSSVGGFFADTIPHWAGGLPAEAPPRPTDPRYEEYERALHAKAEGPAKSQDLKAESGEMPTPAKR